MMVCPTLEYASTVWDPYKQTDAQLLEKVQHRAERYVWNNLSDRTPSTEQLLLDNLEWSYLEQCRLHN